MASCSKEEESVEGESTTGPNWLALPEHITANILKRLRTVELVTSACLVCPTWWNICKDPFIWSSIQIKDRWDITESKMRIICRFAIKRSCGQLEDVDIVRFVDDRLLYYLADRSSGIRRLRLRRCWMLVSDKGLRKVVKKFPLLEELDLSEINLSKETLEVIGLCCPLLKSLKFDTKFPTDLPCDEEAFVIAKTMPGLCSLAICANGMTNVGLHAILNGCPLLESLNILDCVNLDLSGILKERCLQQIKDLRLPTDYSFNDIFYDYEDEDDCDLS